MLHDNDYVALMMLHTGDADAYLSGTENSYKEVFGTAKQISGFRPCCKYAASMHIAMTKNGTYFLADTDVNSHPSAETLECIAVLADEAVRYFDITPVMAMTSYSNFGEYSQGSPAQVRECVCRLHDRYPEMIVDGEMHVSVALDKELRKKEFPFSVLGDRDVNTIIFPNLSSGNVGLGMLQKLGANEVIGPILLGMAKPVHIVRMGCSVSEIVQIATFAVSDAQREKIDMCRI